MAGIMQGYIYTYDKLLLIYYYCYEHTMMSEARCKGNYILTVPLESSLLINVSSCVHPTNYMLLRPHPSSVNDIVYLQSDREVLVYLMAYIPVPV